MPVESSFTVSQSAFWPQLDGVKEQMGPARSLAYRTTRPLATRVYGPNDDDDDEDEDEGGAGRQCMC